MIASSRHPLDKGAMGDNLEYIDIIEEMLPQSALRENGAAVCSPLFLQGGCA